MTLPDVKPMALTRLREPFSDPDWIFEVKHDGFRALAYLVGTSCHLVSRRGHVYKSFRTLCDWVAADLRVQDAILDGEIVCLDRRGHSRFNELLYHRGEPRFYAFDLLWLNGEDLRSLPLIDRKRALWKIMPKHPSRLLYVDHVERRGEDLFRLTCERDLEGVVAKWKRGAYVEGDRTSWVKIKNPTTVRSGRNSTRHARKTSPRPPFPPGWVARQRLVQNARSRSNSETASPYPE